MLNKIILFVKSSVTLPQGDGVPYQRITTLVRLLKIQKCKLPKFKNQAWHWLEEMGRRISRFHIGSVSDSAKSPPSVNFVTFANLSHRSFLVQYVVKFINVIWYIWIYMMFSDVAEYLHLNMMWHKVKGRFTQTSSCQSEAQRKIWFAYNQLQTGSECNFINGWIKSEVTSKLGWQDRSDQELHIDQLQIRNKKYCHQLQIRN